jgi:hypothetical protein
MKRPKNDGSLAVAVVELVTAYVMTHPHAADDVKRLALHYTARVARAMAYTCGVVALEAERRYHEMQP